MNIAVIGTGYVGLVAGACFADKGYNVICVENDLKKLEKLQQGIIPFFEPKLKELVTRNINKTLTFTKDVNDAVKKSLICFIAVGTPQNQTGDADLTNVVSVAEEIAKAMNSYKIIVNKSTAPVGSLEKIKNIIKSHTTQDFDIVSNPEFLKQGNAVDDFLYPDRIIIGSESEKANKIMEEIYSPFIKSKNNLIYMDIKSAEMTKYTANAFLATKISFMNEIANLCEKIGANVDMIKTGIACDSRIGKEFLSSGIGFGGSCFPKDINALVKMGDNVNYDMDLIKVVENINLEQRKRFVKKITSVMGEDLNGKTFGIWGLSFKPNTNDMREAPSITIINLLIEKGATIKTYDPKAMDTAKLYFDNRITYCDTAYNAIKDTDAMVLLTEWEEFINPDFGKIKSLLKKPIIFDGRNQYDKCFLKENGFEYYCIGK